jgi:hypothetical protein
MSAYLAHLRAEPGNAAGTAGCLTGRAVVAAKFANGTASAYQIKLSSQRLQNTKTKKELP